MSTPTPWYPLRPYQESPTENYYDPEPEDIERAFTKIANENGETIINAHDCFEFREGDAELICRAVNLHDELVEALTCTVNGTMASKSQDEILDLLKRARGEL